MQEMEEPTHNVQRTCFVCGETNPRSDYSKNQWKKDNNESKCKTCIVNATSTPATRAREPPSVGTSNRDENGRLLTSPISLDPRPQKPVFDGDETGLTVCTDWPKTKKGQPPGAQSAIFMPLLACTLGQAIKGHCTAEQLETATLWWTAAIPAWPRWVKALRDAGVADQFQQLLSSRSLFKGQPNPIIHKAKGRGTVPHLFGKKQKELLELCDAVLWELEAAIMSLYTKGFLETDGHI